MTIFGPECVQNHVFYEFEKVSTFTTLARNDIFWSNACRKTSILPCKTSFAFITPSPLSHRMAIFDPAAPKKAIPCESGEGEDRFASQNTRLWTHSRPEIAILPQSEGGFLPNLRFARE